MKLIPTRTLSADLFKTLTYYEEKLSLRKRGLYYKAEGIMDDIRDSICSHIVTEAQYTAAKNRFIKALKELA